MLYEVCQIITILSFITGLILLKYGYKNVNCRYQSNWSALVWLIRKFNYSANIKIKIDDIICFTHLNSSIYHAMPSDLSQVPVILASINVIDRPIVQNELSIDRFDFGISTAPYQLPQLRLKILVVFHLKFYNEINFIDIFFNCLCFNLVCFILVIQ